jgi:AsmA-like C-terminal region
MLPISRARSHGATLLRVLRAAGLVFLFLFSGLLLIFIFRWPFNRKDTIESLERVSLSDVQVAGFKKIFFPGPGYIAHDVTFTRGHNPGDHPIAKIGRLRCQATWLSVLTFTYRISRMEAETVRVYIPTHIPPSIQKHPDVKIRTMVDEVVASGAVLDIAGRHQGSKDIHFEFPELVIRNVAKDRALNFRANVRNPNPPGDLRVSGAVGPLALGKVGDTQIAGLFRFIDANLRSYKVITGDLSAEGSFNGRLAAAQITGNAKVLNFGVTSSRHSMDLSVAYHAMVDGTRGNVLIDTAKAHLLGTTLIARGNISGQEGKTAAVDLAVEQGRIQDLLRLFVSADRPPLEGPVNLRAHIVLPPSREPFIRRIRLDGEFSINQADFTNPVTQEKVDELSTRAEGNKAQIKSENSPQRITEDLKSNVSLRNGKAILISALFAVPGAVARGGGTYDVATEAIDLKGKLAIHASLSKAASGLKSVFLLPLDPFFRKGGVGTVLPVHVTGTYSHPVFKISLSRSQ